MWVLGRVLPSHLPVINIVCRSSYSVKVKKLIYSAYHYQLPEETSQILFIMINTVVCPEYCDAVSLYAVLALLARLYRS